MRQKLLIICILLAAGTGMLRAQDYPATLLDGPAVKADSLSVRPEPSFIIPEAPALAPVMPPSLLLPSLDFETKEERAARINRMTSNRVMTSVDLALMGFKPPGFTRGERYMFRAFGLFLSNPNKFPDGCVPLMNASFPFAFFKVPGRTAVPSPYSPDFFPQCIRTEYDFATGTYKQVLVKWDTYQNLLSARPQGIQYNAPVPKVNLNPGDRIVNAP